MVDQLDVAHHAAACATPAHAGPHSARMASRTTHTPWPAAGSCKAKTLLETDHAYGQRLKQLQCCPTGAQPPPAPGHALLSHSIESESLLSGWSHLSPTNANPCHGSSDALTQVQLWFDRCVHWAQLNPRRGGCPLPPITSLTSHVTSQLHLAKHERCHM